MTEIEIYDTTLRDGSQGEGVNLSLADKLQLARVLDWLGVAWIEGGWPLSNDKDRAFFREARALSLSTARLAAFGSTRHFRNRPEEDPNLQALVAAEADACCIFGKTWDLHVRDALRVSLDDNLEMIASSVAYLRRATGRPVFYDAEHFFDGFRANPEYALATLAAAWQAGAERLVLCDTNGGSLPEQVTAAVQAVRARFPEAWLGIHVHNDGGLAVANTLAAVAAGCRQVQGTINGIGERCGNVDLCPVIANLELKLGRRCLPEGRLSRLTEASRAVWERVNFVAPPNQPFVGRAAFAHKGGVHVSAVQRNTATYEHVPPESVGNERRILISELAGRSNIQAKLAARFPALTDQALLKAILDEVVEKEHRGWSFEAAEGSFELLVRRRLGSWKPAFKLHHYRVHGLGTDSADHLVEATVKLEVNGQCKLCVAEGHGPVDALNGALRAALHPSYPELADLHLTDYKVRVVDSKEGTAARVRVLIEHSFRGRSFGTVGVSENIIEASWDALVEGIECALQC
ncbi:MAG: citramalate synthase [Planctomycetota bacterium]|nr:citramalate synthase [Planctomycetota bacterium]MCX8040569.1 citramalate synthase [Planctomycetota bacterium]MDW8372189.1 citramalate synthase [Planctomycetota bacterium]